MAIEGNATPAGTQRYVEKIDGPVRDHFRSHRNILVSSIGLGTYLGDATDEDDDAYEQAVIDCVSGGINHVDTAINYRFQRSEKSIGRALKSLCEEGDFSRDEIVIASKAGFVPFEDDEPEEPLDFISEEFIEPGVVSPDDFTRNGHCMHPDYLEHQLTRSLENLNLNCLDVYYVHNPETQLSEKSQNEFFDDLKKAFERLETLADRGKIEAYGIATWDGLRVDTEEQEYLDIEEVNECARMVNGDDNRFEAVQLPLNLGMSEALTKANQSIDGELLTPLEACRNLGLMTVASASILQGRLAKTLPDEIREDLDEFDSDALKALQFTRSSPGITTALVGMKSPAHVTENLRLTETEPFAEETFVNRFLREVP